MQLDDKTFAHQLLTHREEGLTTGMILGGQWRRLLIRAIFFGALIAIYYQTQGHWILLIASGMLVGATVQDIGWSFAVARKWPQAKAYINWDSVEAATKE